MARFQHENKNGNCTNCRNVQREIELIKQMEMIKLEIMRRLNISSAEKEADIHKENITTTTTSKPEIKDRYYEHRGADILSYSEPAGKIF